MGLDIVAHSNLRFVAASMPDDESEELVHVYAADRDRRGSLAPGVYAPLTLADLWWRAEHGAEAQLPDAERPRIDVHVKGVLAEKKASCPGDVAVLVEDPAVGDSHSFRAGSYSGYNRWREALCQFALECDPDEVWTDPEFYEGRPFVELIDFSDAEGCIAGSAAVKLSRDFDDHAARAKAWKGADESFVALYEEWQQAFALAAHNGVVIFC